MWLRAVGCLFLGLAVLVAGGQAGGTKDKKDPAKDAPKKDAPVKDGKDEKKDPAKDPRAVKGKVMSVDLKGNSFDLDLFTSLTKETAKSEKRTFKVAKDTEFWGPRGGMGEGLKDDRMEIGYEILVIPSKDGLTALEVHLPYRKLEEKKKDKDKGVVKDKKK